MALREMVKGKLPRPDGVVTKFFKVFWSLIKLDYLNRVNKTIKCGKFPIREMKAVILLVHKDNSRSRLMNWRSITLLNIAYKFFAKVVQKKLQLILMEVISFQQCAFLSMRIILNNILLTHEMMEWTEQIGQPFIFLKLDFSKAYDIVD